MVTFLEGAGIRPLKTSAVHCIRIALGKFLGVLSAFFIPVTSPALFIPVLREYKGDEKLSKSVKCETGLLNAAR